MSDFELLIIIGFSLFSIILLILVIYMLLTQDEEDIWGFPE